MIIPSEDCARCKHSDNDHYDGFGVCDVEGCDCESYTWVDEPEDMSGATYLDGTNNER